MMSRRLLGGRMLSPMLHVARRDHHYRVDTNPQGGQTLQWLRAHTQQEAGALGVTPWFANRHIAEVTGAGNGLSPSIMSAIISRQAQLRNSGEGLGKPEFPPMNTVIAIPPGMKSFPEVGGKVSTSSPQGEVLGIGTAPKGGGTPSVNSEATVTRNKHGVINHLDSSN